MNILDTNNPIRMARRAFTLVEVMVSMALVLLIVFGVSQVFKMSSNTVGANQALATIVRDHRAAHATMSEDFKNCLPDSPLFLISSHIAYNGSTGVNAAYRNAQEKLDDADGNPLTYVINGASYTQPVAMYADRNPRLDKVAFFARDVFHRQTANDNQTISTDTSNEAYVWYGHTQTMGGVYPNEQYMGDRILGRVAILMRDAAFVPNTDGALRASNLGNPTADDLSPIDRHNNADKPTLESRWDVANITVDQWRLRANRRYNNNPLAWFLPMDDDAPGNGTFQYRFKCNPVLARPFDAAKLAATVPYFVGHCTQFIVEYAGDFLNQDPNSGAVIPGPGGKPGVSAYTTDGTTIVRGSTDGQIDFVVESNGTRRIRWYGLPRDVDADGFIKINDVVPFRDVLDALGISGYGAHEKVMPSKKLSECPGKDYMQYNGSLSSYAYVCAWHNDAPQMIRITIKIDDPASRLQDGQWYEYVLAR